MALYGTCVQITFGVYINAYVETSPIKSPVSITQHQVVG
jgi:hypothetical protein